MPGDKSVLADDALVQASRQGDLESFNQLVERYQAQVYNLALSMLHDLPAAEDVTQEAFLSAYRAIRSYRGESFRAWLFRIAVNACKDVVRRRARRPATSLEQALDAGEHLLEAADPGEGPEDYALRRERHRVLARLLSELPSDQRAVVLLSDVHGLSYEEIAQITGEPLGTVKSRLSRGRARLRDLLKTQGELFPLVQRLSNEGLHRG